MHLSMKYTVLFLILFSFPVGGKANGQQTSSNANDMVSQTREANKEQMYVFRYQRCKSGHISPDITPVHVLSNNNIGQL